MLQRCQFLGRNAARRTKSPKAEDASWFMFLCLCHVHGKQRKQPHADLSAAWPQELAFSFITELNVSAEQRLTPELGVCSEQRACPLAGCSGVGTASNKNLEGVLWKQTLICIYKGPNYICKVERL